MDPALEKRLYKESKGFRCPCCDQYCRLYKRKLHAQMAMFLIILVRRVGLTGKYVHVKDIISAAPGGKNSTDATYLAHWGLIRSRLAGYWQPTALGVQFANAEITVPKYIYLYDNRLKYQSPEHTTIIAALGSKFDYKELMHPELVL